MKKNYILLLFMAVMLLGCGNDAMYLKYALRSAGENRTELEKVLDYYKNDKLKLAAAKYLIANMPAHYSYADTCAADSYYDIALKVMADTTMTPEQQRDSLRYISDSEFSALLSKTVPDHRIITADYLIYSIDHAFEQWRTRPWAKHLSYTEFRDWLLPYKNVDLQSFDAWRDTLSANFCDSISIIDGVNYNNRFPGNIGLVEAQAKLNDTPDSILIQSLAWFAYPIWQCPWTSKNMGPLYVPGKGDKIELTQWHCSLYGQIIEYETGMHVEFKDSMAYLGQTPVREYVFKDDYFYVLGDNSVDSGDSRFWGFVPGCHVIGTAKRILWCRDRRTDTFRWNRFLKRI